MTVLSITATEKFEWSRETEMLLILTHTADLRERLLTAHCQQTSLTAHACTHATSTNPVNKCHNNAENYDGKSDRFLVLRSTTRTFNHRRHCFQPSGIDWKASCLRSDIVTRWVVSLWGDVYQVNNNWTELKWMVRRQRDRLLDWHVKHTTWRRLRQTQRQVVCVGLRVSRCLVLFYIHQINWLNSHNDFLIPTVLLTLSWVSTLLILIATTSSATTKSTARPSCLVGVLYDISREKLCGWLISHFYVIGHGHKSYRIRRNNAK